MTTPAERIITQELVNALESILHKAGEALPPGVIAGPFNPLQLVAISTVFARMNIRSWAATHGGKLPVDAELAYLVGTAVSPWLQTFKEARDEMEKEAARSGN